MTFEDFKIKILRDFRIENESKVHRYRIFFIPEVWYLRITHNIKHTPKYYPFGSDFYICRRSEKRQHFGVYYIAQTRVVFSVWWSVA